MHSYRVVCTYNPQKSQSKTTVDFTIADEDKAKLTHYQLFRLRKFDDQQTEWLLPPILLHEQTGGISIVFDKPETATDEQIKKLAEITPLIKCEFNKFKHYNQESTLEITDRNIAYVYDDIDPYQSPTNQQEADLFERIKRSKRINQQLGAKSKRHNPLLKYYTPEP
ncbi:MAG: hypothetical protein E7020_05725 [Alphaproteobacteria bacterium]|nr:hypothetical protein [Alphaproteobacteria bacterium]